MRTRSWASFEKDALLSIALILLHSTEVLDELDAPAFHLQVCPFPFLPVFSFTFPRFTFEAQLAFADAIGLFCAQLYFFRRGLQKYCPTFRVQCPNDLQQRDPLS